MYYLVFGKDRKEAIEKGVSLARGLLAKKPDASYSKIGADNWHENIIDELSGTQGLFENKYIILADAIWGDGVAVSDDIDRIATSDNIFIVVETNAHHKTLEKLKKFAEKWVEVKEKKESEEKLNVFSLSDAMSSKDKKKLWILYRQAISEGVSPEEIHGILFWQLKNLILAKRELLSGALKVSPFVKQKARGYSSKWDEADLEELVIRMAETYHRSRLGLSEFETSLEKLILEM